MFITQKQLFLKNIFPQLSNCTKNWEIFVNIGRLHAPKIERLPIQLGGLEFLITHVTQCAIAQAMDKFFVTYMFHYHMLT